jgi:DNA-binding CsgD family transcriptional regulator
MQQREALEQCEALDEGCLLLPVRRVREDALPENLDYADSGCDIWERCLTCPLPRCRYDEPGGARQLFLRERDREIARLYRGDGVRIDELARRFGISRRSVFRSLRRATSKRLAIRQAGQAS